MNGTEYIGTFNNEKRDDVAEVKSQAAVLINAINTHGKDARRNSIACHVEEAAMMAVKSIFTD